MKKTVLLVFVFCIVLTSLAYGEVHKDIYVRSLRVDKVYMHDLGYAVLYYKPSGSGFGMIFIPYTWLTRAGGAAEIIWGRDSSYPYVSVFWVDGKFTRLKLYVQENMTHISWARLYETTEKIKSSFKVTPDTFKIEF